MSPDLRVQLLLKPGSRQTGTGRYADELLRGLGTAGIDVTTAKPSVLPSWLNRVPREAGLDLSAFLSSYPLHASLDPSRLLHIPTQTMATVLWAQHPLQPVVVTVLDIIPLLVRQDPALRVFRHRVDESFYRQAVRALQKADAVIAISDYTKQTLVDEVGLPADRIHAIPLGVDAGQFSPQPVSAAFLAQHGLRADVPYALYVGSEDPRKNLPTLLRAVALARRHLPELELLKVGVAHHQAERQRLTALADDLGIRDAIHFVEAIPDADLPHFYRAAKVLALPSFYEGFGLPVLEAMACGTPAVIANRTSLPEVGGALALQVNPDSAEALAEALVAAIERPPSPADLRAHALRFSWQTTVAQTLRVYEGVWPA